MDADHQDFEYLVVGTAEQSNERSSALLAKEFARAYERSYGVEAEVVGVERDDVDAIIRVSGEEVAVEFAAYIQRDEFHESEVADTQARQQVGKALKAAGLPPLKLSLWWRTEPRRKKGRARSRDIARVPKGDDLERVAGEVVRISQEVLRTTAMRGRRILPRPGGDRIGTNRREGRHWTIDSAEFPALASFCQWVQIDVHEGPGWPEIRSSAAPRNFGLDDVAMTQVVDKHVGKLTRYRQGAAGRPVWLVIHGDGWPASRRIPEPHRERALTLIRERAEAGADRFDQVWWAEWTGFVDATKLYPVALSAQE